MILVRTFTKALEKSWYENNRKDNAYEKLIMSNINGDNNDSENNDEIMLKMKIIRQ